MTPEPVRMQSTRLLPNRMRHGCALVFVCSPVPVWGCFGYANSRMAGKRCHGLRAGDCGPAALVLGKARLVGTYVVGRLVAIPHPDGLSLQVPPPNRDLPILYFLVARWSG